MVWKSKSTVSKIVRVGPEGDGRTAPVGRLALLQRARLGVVVLLPPDEAVLVDLHGHPAGEGVDDRDADAVQAAGDRVRLAVELAARVQHGQRHLDARLLELGVQVDREAPAVVGDPDPPVGEQHHVDGVAVTGHRLVHGVVDDLPHQVVQATLAGRPDVHTGPLADRLQPFEDGDRLGAVLLIVLRCHPRPLSRAVRAVRHVGRGFGGTGTRRRHADRHRGQIPGYGSNAPVAADARGSRSARPESDSDRGPAGGPVTLRSAPGLRLTPILLCAGDRTTSRHPFAAAQIYVAGRTALSATPPTRQGMFVGSAARRDAGPAGPQIGRSRPVPCTADVPL